MALYDNLKNLIAGGTLFADTPLGTINAFGGNTAPDGWLMCQGQAVSRTTYAELFAVIGTNYGAGDGSTTFNLPDMKGKVPVGYNSNETEFNALGKTGGEKTHKLTTTEMPSHTHSVHYTNGTNAGWSVPTANKDTGAGWGPPTTPAGGDGAHNNLQPYETVNFIIKAKQVGIPQDFLTQLEELLDSKQLLSWGNGT